MPRRGVWTPEAIAKLGTMPDAQLAAELGITSKGVAIYRARHGVQRYSPPVDKPAVRPADFGTRVAKIAVEAGRSLWTDERVALLGTMPDRLLAEQLDVSKEAVRSARATRKIPPYSPPTRATDAPERAVPCRGCGARAGQVCHNDRRRTSCQERIDLFAEGFRWRSGRRSGKLLGASARSQRMHIKFTLLELESIETAAGRAGITATQWVRQRALAPLGLHVPDEEDHEQD